MKKQAKPCQPVEEVKTEPSTSTAPLKRLPSLRPPRDLTLSAYCQKILNPNTSKIKKIYIPNLNIQRNKHSENTSTSAKSVPVEPICSKTLQSKESHLKKTFVQLNQGLFSQGIPEQKNFGRGHSGRGKVATNSALVRPVLKLQENIKINKREEEDIIKNLLKDDFLDDPSLETDIDRSPTVLPGAKQYAAINKNCVLGNNKIEEKRTVEDVFSSNNSDPGFILFQLPHSMPAIRLDPTDTKHNPTNSSITGECKENKLDCEPSRELCPLSALPGGQIGKLQILKSGKVRLLLGDIKMCVEMGTQVTFKQDVVSAKLDEATHSGDLINIGPVKTRIVVTPDFKETLSSNENSSKTPVN